MTAYRFDCFGCKEPPAGSLPSASIARVPPGRAYAPGRPTGLSDRPLALVRSGCVPPVTQRFCYLLPLRRCGGCRRSVARGLLDNVQPQLACLPPQRLDLLLLHPVLVLLLALAHVRQAVLQRQV